jgi:DNA-binding transcriptional LysR family regulator
MSLHLDMVDMRLLVSVAEHNSVTRGAEACHLSTPAASSRIRNLEEAIGTRLFQRRHQGVTLTPSGQAFVLHARQVLAQVERLASELQEYAHGIKGHLRVFANTTALEFLPPVLRAYLQSHPDVSVDLRERPSHDVVRAVSAGQTDVGIVAGTVRTEDLQVLAYRSDRLVLVVPRGHALARRKRVAFADTLQFDYVGLPESSAIHAFLQQVCAGLDRPIKLRIQVGNFEAACRMIEARVGIGVMPRAAARRHAQTMAIATVALTDAWALRELKICVRALGELPRFARDLVDLLVDDARKARPA